jgi:two-component system sensor histidine kinase/response regulator
VFFRGHDTCYADEAEFHAIGEHIAAAVATQGYFREDHELIRKDGSRFWARIQARPIDPADPSRGLAGMIEDITAERAAIAAMDRARMLAEDAAQTKANFLANMSHEIRTPMNAIIGMSHLALKTELTPRQREYLRKIQSSSQHLLGILNDILDFSKIEAGKMLVERIDFDLEEVLSNVTAQVVERAVTKGLELIVDVEAAVPRYLIGDPLRIGQVLINVASNAVKFTERGEIAILVQVLTPVNNELLVRFAVRDTGIGIAEAHRRRGHAI